MITKRTFAPHRIRQVAILIAFDRRFSLLAKGIPPKVQQTMKTLDSMLIQDAPQGVTWFRVLKKNGL